MDKTCVIVCIEDLIGTSRLDSSFQPSRAQFHSVSTELALTEAGNSVLTASVFHRLVGNYCVRACLGILRLEG